MSNIDNGSKDVGVNAKKNPRKSSDQLSSGLLDQLAEDIPGLKVGMDNLEKIRPFDGEGIEPIPGTGGFSSGVIALSRDCKGVVVASEHFEAQEIRFDKFVALVENMEEVDDKRATIVIQPCHEGEYGKPSRPQVLGRINGESSAIMVVKGVSGELIREKSSKYPTFFYVPREMMLAYYLMAKYEAVNQGRVEEIKAIVDGPLLFPLSKNPLMPHLCNSVNG